MMKSSGVWGKKMELLGAGLVQALACIALLFLWYCSAANTALVYGGEEHVLCLPDSLWIHLLILGLIAGGIWISAERWPWRGRAWLPLFLLGLFLLFWLIGMPGVGGSDSRACIHAAECLLRGDYSPWAPLPFAYGGGTVPTGYAFTYPNQNGLILWLTPLVAAAGEGAPVLARIINILLLIAGLWCLMKVTGIRPGSAGAWAMAAFLPFHFYVMFVYGTVPGFSLGVIGWYLLGQYLEKGGVRSLLGALCLTAAVLLKSNYLILLVAVLTGLLLRGIGEKCPRAFLAFLLVVVIWQAGSRGSEALIRQLTGGRTDSGIPMTAWVEMGLEDGSRAPGWFNWYNVNVFEQAGGDRDAAARQIKKDLQSTWQSMEENPVAWMGFLYRKTISQWAEPTGQSLWIQEMGGNAQEGKWQASLLLQKGELNRLYVLAFNLFQSLIYAGAALYLLPRRGKGQSAVLPPGALMPVLIFLGGFMFHLFWEAKAQYTVVYQMLLIPAAAKGFAAWGERLREMRYRGLCQGAARQMQNIYSSDK